ncbi:hypothetical protein F5Y07DRAFT_384937 [Xylaria sp. FL0933]|nr:hypothetical protein F5Y07DRAFT_384937 [Xylaria sp. FL0933]
MLCSWIFFSVFLPPFSCVIVLTLSDLGNAEDRVPRCYDARKSCCGPGISRDNRTIFFSPAFHRQLGCDKSTGRLHPCHPCMIAMLATRWVCLSSRPSHVGSEDDAVCKDTN